MKPSGRIEPQGFMTAASTSAVLAALDAAGFAARFVGGCVRDALIDRPIKDVDIATDARPDQVIEALDSAGLKAIPTGLQHGTVTAVAEGDAFEVTTLRRDVSTDGRHAEVAFTDDWTADAARRDFTFNALFLEPDGRYYDFFGGVADLRAGIVRFVGDPAARIAEDYLRILRMFRFHAHYGLAPISEPVIALCRSAAPNLARLSAERIRDETLKLLAAPDPGPAWRGMMDAGVVAQCYPSLTATESLAALVTLETELDRPDPLRRLAALIEAPDPPVAAIRLGDGLRLSNDQKQRLRSMLDPVDPPLTVDSDARAVRRALFFHGRQSVIDQLVLAAAGHEAGRIRQSLALAESWTIPSLPVTGRDALALGAERGPAIGQAIDALRSWWAERDFAPDEKACREELSRLLSSSSS